MATERRDGRSAPQFGRPHWAQFRFDQPVDLGSGEASLRVTLVQDYGKGRVIGKPQISVFVGDPVLLEWDDALVALARKTELRPAQT